MVGNVIDELYESLSKVQKKQFEQACLGFLAKGEQIGKKKILFDLDLWNGLNQNGKPYFNLNKYIKAREEELGKGV
jgi:hypothetical protein